MKFAVNKGLYENWHSSIPRYRRALHRLTAELERARRYGNSLTIAFSSVDADQQRQRKRSFINHAYARSHRTASETPSPKDDARPSQETQRREFLAK